MTASAAPASANDKQCRYCGQTFRKREHVVRHERSHSGERPFACGVCGDSFARQDTLLRHTRIHANKKEGDDETMRPGPTGSRRRKSGRTSGASTPRSRHQSPVLAPLTSLDGLQSPSQLSLSRQDGSSNNSRAASPLAMRPMDAALPQPSFVPTWHFDASLAQVPLFAVPTMSQNALGPRNSLPSTTPPSSAPISSSPGLAYQHNQYNSAPSLLRKRTHTPSSDGSESDNESLLSDYETASPRLTLSRDPSSSRLSEQVERWAPLGPGLLRSIVAPTSDTRSRPPSPTMPRSQSSPQLHQPYPSMMASVANSEGESASSAEGDSPGDHHSLISPRSAMMSNATSDGTSLRSPTEMVLDDFGSGLSHKPPKSSPLAGIS